MYNKLYSIIKVIGRKNNNIIIKDFDYIGFDKFQSFMKEEGLEID
jgi:hypothetical protein